MSDLERVLRDLAGPDEPVDLGAVDRRATRIRRRRQGLVGGVVASVVLVAGVLVVSAWDRDPGQPVVVAPPETTTPPDTTTAPESSLEPRVACPAPEFAPTYLPWVGEMSEPAEPDRVESIGSGWWALYFAGSDDDLADDAPSSGSEPSFFSTMAVAISTRPSLDDLPLGPREVTSIGELRGHEAYLVWVGDPGVGGVFIAWDEDDGSPCSTYRVEFPSTGPIAEHLGLSVVDDPNPTAPIQDELIRVVESLVYVEPESEEEVEIVQCPPADLYPTTVPWDHGDGPIGPVDWMEYEGGTRAIYSDMPEDYPDVGLGDIRMLVSRGDAGAGFDREAARSEFGFGEVRGTEAFLIWARDGGIGGASLSWEESPGELCGFYTVSFRMNHELTNALGANWFDRAEAEAAVEEELVRVAEALERR